jgi:hypothetical protein
MKKKKLLNPRGYLSWTQVDMWLRSPVTYARRYFDNEAGFENDAMRFGKVTSDALEHDRANGDDIMQAVISLLPAYDKPENEIKAPLDTPYGEVIMLGKLDTWKPLAFREYKTGIVPWTQGKAEKHKQILHYATLMFLTEKVVPKAHLDWIQTRRNEDTGEIEFTGHIQAFEVKVTLQMIVQYMALVSRVAKEIDTEYRKRLKALT